MNEISSKNERFVQDSIKALRIFDDLLVLEKAVFKAIQDINNGHVVDVDSIMKKFDEIEYCKIKIDDIASSLLMHASKVVYEMGDVEGIRSSVNKNAYISSVGIPSTIFVSEFLPTFNIDIINLGYMGISKEDIIRIKVHSNSTDTESNGEFACIGIKSIGESGSIEISTMPCPQKQYVYDISVTIENNGVVFAEHIVKSINILDEEGAVNDI